MSSKVRIKIITALLDTPLTVTQICDTINEDQSKVSHNLTNLVQCKIVSFKQDGKHRIYSLNKETIVPILKLVDQHAVCHCTPEEQAVCGNDSCPYNKQP